MNIQLDRTTKLLLAAIAAGLFANAGVSATRPAAAQSSLVSGMASDISAMASDINNIARGFCRNSKLC